MIDYWKKENGHFLNIKISLFRSFKKTFLFDTFCLGILRKTFRCLEILKKNDPFLNIKVSLFRSSKKLFHLIHFIMKKVSRYLETKKIFLNIFVIFTYKLKK